MGDFFVRIDDLSDYASDFMIMAGASNTSIGTLRSGIGDLADCWGTDAAGRAFFAWYEPAATDTLGCALQMPIQLGTLASAMGMTYEAYTGTEAVNTTLSTRATNA